MMGTLPETNIATEKLWLEDEMCFWDGLFLGAMLVSGRVPPFSFLVIRFAMEKKSLTLPAVYVPVGFTERKIWGQKFLSQLRGL